jgi:N-ethylmaleimide reductase
MEDDSLTRCLFDPIEVGTVRLPHRIVMAPMARFRCGEDGVPADYVAEYYAQRATAGLILAEPVYTIPSGRIALLAGGMINANQRAAWKAVAAGVHQRGGRIFQQIIHGGRVSHPELHPENSQPIAPSAVPADDQVRVKGGPVAAVQPRAMGAIDIREVIESFATATADAAHAGFDGVELHAGNGYLPCQFLSSNTNIRTDAYGGSAANRCRFVIEALEAMSAVRGPEFVGVKVSPGFSHHDEYDEDPQTTYAVLTQALSGLNLAYVHVQIPIDIQLPAGVQPPMEFDPVRLVREHYTGVLLAGGNLDRYSAARMIAEDRADVAVFGRRFIANPDLPERIRDNAEENAWDIDTLHSPGPRGYIDYPARSAATAPTGAVPKRVADGGMP